MIISNVIHPKTGMRLMATVYHEFLPNEKSEAEQCASKIEGGFILISNKASNYGCHIVCYPTPQTDFATK